MKAPFYIAFARTPFKTENTTLIRGCLVCDFKQPFLVFKQHFTHFNAFFHPHVFPQIFSNNNFQFLNTYTKRPLLSLCFPTVDSPLSHHIISLLLLYLTTKSPQNTNTANTRASLSLSLSLSLKTELN